MSKPTADEIDNLLPQTQCGLCGYGGCLPYAKALSTQDAPIDLCPPGGIETLTALGNLLSKDPSPYIEAMEQKSKPPGIASIRENICIGCMKCIEACPVDAIIGSAKQMHTVINDICTGCELCVPACPVDCIEMLSLPTLNTPQKKAALSRLRFQNRQNRLAKSEQNRLPSTVTLKDKKNFIQQALLRAKAKKKKS